MKRCITMFVLLAGAIGLQAQSPWTTTTFVAVPLTATNQTSAAVVLQRSAATRDSYSAGKLTVTGVGLTTATFSVLGSADNGATYNVLATEACSTPGTFATSQTVTASPSCYEVNTSSLFAVKFATSGTFTATSISIVLTVNPNAQITRNGGGGGGGGGVESINGDTGAFTFGAGSSCTGTSCTFPGTGGGAVSSVSNSDGSLTVTPTTGAVGASINTAHANTYTATQTFPAASITNAALANSATTVNGQTCALGGACTFPVNTCGGSGSSCPLQQLNPTSGGITTLSAAINNTQTTIPLTSGTGFTFTPGTIVAIANNSPIEWVACTGFSSPNLTGCTRGFYGSVAESFASGSSVIQMTSGLSASASTSPYYYQLANGAAGFGLNASVTGANQYQFAGFLQALAGFSAGGADVSFLGGTSTTALYTDQATVFNDTAGLAGTACYTSGIGYQVDSTSKSSFFGTSTAGCTVGANGIPANSFVGLFGATASAPTTGTAPAFWLGSNGIINASAGYDIAGSPAAITINSINCPVGGSCTVSGGGGGSLPSGTGVVAVNAGAGALATAAQVLGSFSTNVSYASKVSGATPLPVADCIPTASATGLTDSFAALNAITSAGGNDLEVDGCFALSATLNFGSNTRVHGAIPGAGFIMLPSANASVLQNVHLNSPTTASGTGGFIVSNQTDQNIVASYLMLNANSLQAATGTNSEGTAHGATPGGLFTYCTNFVGVNGLVLDHDTCYDSAAFEFFQSNDSNVYITNDTAFPVLPIVAKKFTDCVHFIGPDTETYDQNNTLTCGDDSIAYNADDGNRTGSGDINATYIASYVKWGPITQFHDDNNTLLNSYYGPRLYSATELIDQGEISNLHGNLCGNTGTIVAQTSLGVGNMGTIRIEGWNLPTTGTCNNFGFPFNFLLNTNIANLDIAGVQETNPGVNWPMFSQTGGAIGSLSIRGWNLNTQTSGFSNVLSFTGGTVGQISTDANQWFDATGTGSFFSGTVVPATLTCSNFSGPTTRLLGPGYSPANQLGDCFTAASNSTTFVSTVFNEAAAATNLAGTTPAICGGSCTGPWALASGTDFTYQTGGGVSTATANGQFDVVNTGLTNEKININLAACTATGFGSCAFAVRYTNINNFTSINVEPAQGTFVIFDVVGGTATQVATSSTSTFNGNYAITLNGTSISVAGPATTASATIANTGTKAGFTLNTGGGTSMKVSTFSASTLSTGYKINGVSAVTTINGTSCSVGGSCTVSSAVSNAITSATGGSGTGTVTCLTAACTNLRGSYSVAGGTFTTGTFLTLVWPTTTTAYVCTVVQNGLSPLGFGHTVATATGMAITTTATIAATTVSVDYTCTP
jgi:hypothetical protein